MSEDAPNRHNLITAAGYLALSSPDHKMRVEGAAERLVHVLFFVREAEWPGPMCGSECIRTASMRCHLW